MRCHTKLNEKQLFKTLKAAILSAQQHYLDFPIFPIFPNSENMSRPPFIVNIIIILMFH